MATLTGHVGKLVFFVPPDKAYMWKVALLAFTSFHCWKWYKCDQFSRCLLINSALVFSPYHCQSTAHLINTEAGWPEGGRVSKETGFVILIEITPPFTLRGMSTFTLRL